MSVFEYDLPHEHAAVMTSPPPPSIGRHALVGALLGCGVGMILGAVDAFAALDRLSRQGSGGAGFISAMIVSPIYLWFGARNGIVFGVPAFALGAAMLAGMASVYRDQPGALGRASTWTTVRIVLTVLGIACAATWVLLHPTQLFDAWQ